MIYELAIVEDRGSYWAVTSVTKNSFDMLANRDEKYLKLSYMAYKIITTAIMEGQTVRIKKSLTTDEVLPGEVDILDKDVNDINYLRNASYVKMKMLVTPEMTKESGFTLYNFMIKNNELASKGFIITDENREEKYIEIIETSDEALIETLESYLESKDLIARAASISTRLAEYKEKVFKLTTQEDINKAEEEFLAVFYQ